MKDRRVLIFPAGTEIGLEIFQALKACKEVSVIGAGDNSQNHAFYLFEDYSVIPNVSDASWLSALIDLCMKKNIDYVFPAHDDVLLALAKNREKIPAMILAPDAAVAEILRSKSSTYRALNGVVKVPRMYSLAEVDFYPVFLKPDIGQGSQDSHLIHSREELDFWLKSREDDWVICENLPGDEFTVDCFSDIERGLLFCGARQRQRTRNGIAVNTVKTELPEALVFARKICLHFSMRGAWFFQLKRDSVGDLSLLEIGPRIAGSMALHRALGINFPLLTIFELERRQIDTLTLTGSFSMSRALTNRYDLNIFFESLYIDFDDTIVIKGKINFSALELIFRCIARKIPVILISRHAGDLETLLRSYRLNFIFDKIVHVKSGECKSEFITLPNPIFVDDSFDERRRVHKALGIPTFDTSMLDALVNSKSFTTETGDSVEN